MKVGELLLREGLIRAAQLDLALGLHRRFGYRVGSILVELGYLDADTLARALSGQLRVPAVLARHVAAIDPKIIAIFSPRLAAEARAIPLGYTNTSPRRLLVALRDPTTTPTEELAFAAGARIDVAIAPEIVIAGCLERYYKVKRDWSELRLAVGAGGGTTDMSDSWPPAPLPPASAPQPPSGPRGALLKPTPSRPMLTLSLPPAPISRGAAPPSAETPRVEVIDAPLIEVELPSPPREPTAVAEDVVDEAPHELGEEDANGAPPRAEAEWDDLFAEPSPPSGLPRPMTAPPGVLRPVLDVAAAALALEDATTRDEVGETLTTWLLSEYECGLVLIVKDGLALGWKGHAPDAEQDIIESIAMPLGPPSMLTAAYEQRVAVCGPPPSEGAALQTRLWKLLRCSPPSEVLVAPIVLGQRVVNLLYAHTSATFPSSTASDATRVAAAASSAYARLIRQKK